jgi:hypothetical protein
MAQLMEQYGRKHRANIKCVIECGLATPCAQYEKKGKKNKGKVQSDGYAKNAKSRPGWPFPHTIGIFRATTGRNHLLSR